MTGPDGTSLTTSTAVQELKTTHSVNPVGGSFIFTYDGKSTAKLAFDITASNLKVALDALHSPTRSVEVTRTDVDAAKKTFKWMITYTNHLDKFAPTGTGTSVTLKQSVTDLITDGTVSLSMQAVAQSGAYPVNYIPWIKGSYSVAITGSSGVHIKNSPFAMTVAVGAVHPASSTASGPGLSGGVAGTPFKFTVQAKDTRRMEIQTVSTSAVVVDVVEEQQSFTCNGVDGDSFKLTFRGAQTGAIAGSATGADIKTELDGLATIASNGVTVTIGGNSDTTKACSNSLIIITFKHDDLHRGDIEELTVASSGGSPTLPSTATEVKKGVTPYRKEIQKISCSSSDGVLTLTYRGQTTTNLNYNDNANTVDTALEALSTIGTGGVSITGSSLCAGLFVTFEKETGNLLPMTLSTVSGTVSSPVVTDSCPECQSGIHPLWGNFKLIFGGEKNWFD
jgi:hypothetical protein